MDNRVICSKLQQHSECGEIKIASSNAGQNLAVECTLCDEVLFDVDMEFATVVIKAAFEMVDRIGIEDAGNTEKWGTNGGE